MFESYIPVGDAARKLQAWAGEGAQISYLSSHKKVEDVEKDKVVLQDLSADDIHQTTASGFLPACAVAALCALWRAGQPSRVVWEINVRGMRGDPR
jgi:hypothetical protein